MILRTLF